MKFFLFIVITLQVFLSQISPGEPGKEEVLIDSSGGTEILLDTESLELNGNEVVVWVTKRFAEPRQVKFLDKKIKAKKTFYMMNLAIKRYSIIAIKYFDSGNKEVRSFSYIRKSDIPEYNYNFPIYENSIEAKVAEGIKNLVLEK